MVAAAGSMDKPKIAPYARLFRGGRRARRAAPFGQGMSVRVIVPLVDNHAETPAENPP
jgi:hypothetical protein